MAFFESCGSLDQQQLDLLLHLLDGGFQLGDLSARHFAHLLVLVVGEDVLGFGEVSQSRAVTFRGLDDRFQLLVLLVELYELLDVGDDFGVGEFLSRLLVFQFQAVETAQNGVVCHILLYFDCKRTAPAERVVSNPFEFCGAQSVRAGVLFPAKVRNKTEEQVSARRF